MSVIVREEKKRSGNLGLKQQQAQDTELKAQTRKTDLRKTFVKP